MLPIIIAGLLLWVVRPRTSPAATSSAPVSPRTFLKSLIPVRLRSRPKRKEKLIDLIEYYHLSPLIHSREDSSIKNIPSRE
jgi:hypothetical protein